MLDFLRSEGIREEIIKKIEDFRAAYPLEDKTHYRVPNPSYHYYGTEIWEKAFLCSSCSSAVMIYSCVAPVPPSAMIHFPPFVTIRCGCLVKRRAR